MNNILRYLFNPKVAVKRSAPLNNLNAPNGFVRFGRLGASEDVTMEVGAEGLVWIAGEVCYPSNFVKSSFLVPTQHCLTFILHDEHVQLILHHYKIIWFQKSLGFDLIGPNSRPKRIRPDLTISTETLRVAN